MRGFMSLCHNASSALRKGILGPNKPWGGKLGKQYLKMRYKFILYIPTPVPIIHFQREYNSGTQKLVKILLIDSMCLKILQLVRSSWRKLINGGIGGGRNKVRGWEKVLEINKHGGTFFRHQRV